MEVLFVQIWLVIILITLIGSCLYAGYNQDQLGNPFDDVIGPAMFCALLCPFWICLIVIVGPFFGIYKFGEWLRNKKASRT